MNLTNYYRFRIKESKFPDMLEEFRYWGEGMGITPECLTEGRADEPLRMIELTREDVEIVHDPITTSKVCRQYLIDTDWYASRLAETGKAIPQEILDLRAIARENITV